MQVNKIERRAVLLQKLVNAPVEHHELFFFRRVLVPGFFQDLAKAVPSPEPVQVVLQKALFPGQCR